MAKLYSFFSPIVQVKILTSKKHDYDTFNILLTMVFFLHDYLFLMVKKLKH